MGPSTHRVTMLIQKQYYNIHKCCFCQRWIGFWSFLHGVIYVILDSCKLFLANNFFGVVVWLTQKLMQIMRATRLPVNNSPLYRSDSCSQTTPSIVTPAGHVAGRNVESVVIYIFLYSQQIGYGLVCLGHVAYRFPFVGINYCQTFIPRSEVDDKMLMNHYHMEEVNNSHNRCP